MQLKSQNSIRRWHSPEAIICSTEIESSPNISAHQELKSTHHKIILNFLLSFTSLLLRFKHNGTVTSSFVRISHNFKLKTDGCSYISQIIHFLIT